MIDLIPIYEAPSLEDDVRCAVRETAKFFGEFVDIEWDTYSELSGRAVAALHRPNLICSLAEGNPTLRRLLGSLEVNPKISPAAAWSWHQAFYRRKNIPMHLISAHSRFKDHLESWKLVTNRAFIFGTGASLAKAHDFDFSSGFRIACNTIVKDPTIMRHVNPHVLVAGDALYHFSNTEHAIAFQSDLDEAFKYGDFLFAYPDLFDSFVRGRYPLHMDRLLPMPMSVGADFPSDLVHNWSIPTRENVLNLLLLPFATSLSRDIVMLGFDGRKPDDKGFWSNSPAHSYPLLIERMQTSHPAFFDHYVPAQDPTKYIRAAFGNQLSSDIDNLNRLGFKLAMLSETSSPALLRLPIIDSPEAKMS